MTFHEFLFWFKGILSLIGLCLLLAHMVETPNKIETPAQALRYVALLIAAGAVTYASQEQIREQVEWASRQWGGLAVAISVTVAAIVSLVSDRRTRVSTSQQRGSTHD